MGEMNGASYPVMVIGQDRLSYSVVCSLLAGGHPALLLTTDLESAQEYITGAIDDDSKLCIRTDWPNTIDSQLVVLLTADKYEAKDALIRQVEERVSAKAIVAVNLESINLADLQSGRIHKSRIFGLNWTYPVHRTFFAEIISNTATDPADLLRLDRWVRAYWNKDPYVTRKGFSIRARMMAAMLRESLYLVEHGFASVESIDRACRNDAGYYLPFAGNFRYMDLMGTYAYGMVMKDLNQELSNTVALSPILKEKKYKGATGMDAGKGFYTYTPEEKIYWETVFKEFSQDIQQLIAKYPHESFDH